MKRRLRRAIRRPRLVVRRRQRLPWLMAALALAFALWMLRPQKLQPVAAPPPPHPAAAAIPPPRLLARNVRQPPRELLLAALRSHAAELQTCPTGAVQQIPTRIDLSRAGTVRAVAFDSSEPLPRELSECVRTRVLTWKFDEIELPADLEALVTLELR
jgi:hypothetical protein